MLGTVQKLFAHPDYSPRNGLRGEVGVSGAVRGEGLLAAGRTTGLLLVRAIDCAASTRFVS